MKSNTLTDNFPAAPRQRSKPLFVPLIKPHTVVAEIISFMKSFDHAALSGSEPRQQVQDIFSSAKFQELLVALAEAPAFSLNFGKQFAAAQAVEGISTCRILRGALNLPVQHFLALLGQLFSSFNAQENASDVAQIWRQFAAEVVALPDVANLKVVIYGTRHIADPGVQNFYARLAIRIENDIPHAVYPTSNYRESNGSVKSTADDQTTRRSKR